MLRELADALDVLARDTPLVVVLEDLHWSDASTIDLLAYTAERGTPARLLVIGTYRPVEAVVRAHPFRATAQRLIARGRAAETSLELLTADDVRAYLTHRLGGQPMEPRLPELVYRRTGGNPLFLVSVVDHLLDSGMLARERGAWRLAADPDGDVPQTLRELVVRQLDGLGPEERATLAAASVMGVEFDAIAVAAAIGQPVPAVERICARLAELGQLVCTTGMTAWPDGSLGGTYEFLHAFYQEVLYRRLAPSERSRLHCAIGERLEAGHAGDPGAVAATLATHFERSSDWRRAVLHHLAAVTAAKARLADREVAAHCQAVLGLLERLPAWAEREQTEMACCLDRGLSLLAVQGYGAPEVELRFARARDLAIRLQLPQVEILALGGLYTFHVMGGDQRRARELAGDLMALAERFPVPLFTTIGYTTLAAAEYNIGNLLVARDHFAAARAACPPDMPRLQLDPQVLFLSLNALVLQQLGDTAGAEAWSRDALAYATGRDDPVNLAYTYVLTSQFRALADDRPGTIAWADRAMAVAAEHGFPLHEAAARAMKGWALRDLALQRDGYVACVATGQRTCEPMYRLGLARTYLDLDRVADGESELAQGLVFVEESGEARHLAELYRLRSECARRRGALDDAETDLRLAIAVAHAQHSRLFELRAVADLAELLAGRRRAREARALLHPVCAGFVAEGQGPELDRARALYATLRRR